MAALDSRLLGSAVLYGAADVIVLAIGGVLLLPMYTRTLTQGDFGTYVIVKANAEIFTYLLYFGLPSAVTRLYFDYRRADEHLQYLSSIVNFFLVILFVFCAAMYLGGQWFWNILSPATPVYPYLWICVGLATLGFFGALGSLWLRLESRVAAFVGLQVANAIVLVGAATAALVILDMGLPGLFCALLISAGCAALIFPLSIGRRFTLTINGSHITNSLRYAIPIIAGYLAYFVLTRFSTLVLQRYVATNQIAIFGLAQQIAMLITIAAAAFGKALQPAVFTAAPAQAEELLRTSGITLTVIMFCMTALIATFAPDVLTLVAPRNYASGVALLLILLVGNFAYSFNLVFNTALLYHRRPGLSAALTISGAVVSATLALWLIPLYGLFGAAFAVTGAYTLLAFASHSTYRKVTGQSYYRLMIASLVGIGLLAWLVYFLQRMDFGQHQLYFAKAILMLMILSAAYGFLKQQRVLEFWAR